MIKPTAFCDVCGKPKNDVNHWFVIRDMATADEHVKLWFEQWDQASAQMPNALHLCGQDCAIKKVSEFLSK